MKHKLTKGQRIESQERAALSWLRQLAMAGITKGFGRMTVADRQRLAELERKYQA